MPRLLLLLLAVQFQMSVLPGEGPAAPAPIKPLAGCAGLQNVFQIGTNLYSGSAPEGEAGFATLVRLGIRSIITVDGTRPDVELAHRFGMRYAHLPHGYDGIDSHVQLRLIKAAETLPGPIYVHCHHGQHRGPAAAAIICMAREGWSRAEAKNWLIAAGTATNYPGLYDAVRTFRNPSPEELKSVSADFPETAHVPDLAAAMVAIDERFDRLQSVRKAGYTTPGDHPDLQPAREAVLLWEGYREVQRLPEAARRGAEFLRGLHEAETHAKELEALFRRLSAASTEAAPLRRELEEAFSALENNCAMCHKRYRNPSRSASVP